MAFFVDNLRELKDAIESLWKEKGEGALKAEWDYLVAADCRIKKLLDPEFSGCDDEDGNAEVGPVLYTLNHFVGFVKNFTTDVAAEALAFGLQEIFRLLGMPKSILTAENFETVESRGVLDDDGTLLAGDFRPEDYRTFVQFDPGWIQSALLYFAHKSFKHKFHCQVNGPIPLKAKPGGDKTQVKIAVTGDWGTGVWKDGNATSCPSQLVLDGIKSVQPDYVIHLGDVYYAGTVEQEQNNLLNPWTEAFSDLSGSRLFTMNSNHEMYDGADGLFGCALSADNSLFAAQQHATYFSLEFGGFIVLCLDSAYFDPSPLFMNGALYDPEKSPIPNGAQEQLEYMSTVAGVAKQKNKKLIVMTHHNPIEINGNSEVKIRKDSAKEDNSLWFQVTSRINDALGRDPDIWYWGHVHNGIVYGDKQVLGGVDTLCRCAGHGSMPFGDSRVLKSLGPEKIPYYANTLMSKYADTTERQELRMLNGFALLTLSADTVLEDFYEVANGQPCMKVWSNPRPLKNG